MPCETILELKHHYYTSGCEQQNLVWMFLWIYQSNWYLWTFIIAAFKADKNNLNQSGASFKHTVAKRRQKYTTDHAKPLGTAITCKANKVATKTVNFLLVLSLCFLHGRQGQFLDILAKFLATSFICTADD
jgi:hypothetical protein